VNVAGVRTDDIVECDVRGQRFFARVEQPVHKDESWGKRVVTVAPLNGSRSIPTRWATARQIVGHYSKRKGSR